jgi:hypothetical protein
MGLRAPPVLLPTLALLVPRVLLAHKELREILALLVPRVLRVVKAALVQLVLRE